jgi:DNA-binding NarL/FixJ family response regulator
MKESINVLLVDDHAIMREGVASLLSTEEGITVIGRLSSGEEVVNELGNYHPDVILMDIMMSGMTGLEATRWVKETNPNIKVIIVSSEIKKEFVATGIKCGIDGYLPKDTDKQMLVEAIRTVVKGEKYFNNAIMNLVFEDLFHKGEKEGKKSGQKITEGLTKRESEIMEHVAMGKTNREVADTLSISIKTVETHKTNILEKLGLKNTAQLVQYAIRHNIIPLREDL